MARFQAGIVWEDGAKQPFGIFQTHEAAFCGNVLEAAFCGNVRHIRHTQRSLFNLLGLNS